MRTVPYHTISFHRFFSTNIYYGDSSVLPAKNQKRIVYKLFFPSLFYSLANRSEGRNKQSFEEGSSLHFVLISLVALEQNYYKSNDVEP